ncbi:hypothetical protein DHEL01_v210677 [Diaporthe helianthi]|uniref:2,6-dihydroxypyridine 3-monooxygenase substrate binding domain-containing protein n=1 Tax=Diaporthe helianthi TaxID=158607 RepID=A0A2P5HL31_DIAHE|nr:hypothetical protein DHEL01_v210677 [Diaporthe helianthi]
MICDVINPDEGDFASASQLINWVLCQNVPEGSADEAAIFTDASGRRHQRIVPQGTSDPRTWDWFREPSVERVAATLFIELVSVIANPPLITKVSDVLFGKAIVCDGYLVLWEMQGRLTASTRARLKLPTRPPWRQSNKPLGAHQIETVQTVQHCSLPDSGTRQLY